MMGTYLNSSGVFQGSILGSLLFFTKIPYDTVYLRVSINCELRAFPTFAINRFANINVRVYYNRDGTGSTIAIIGFAI